MLKKASLFSREKIEAAGKQSKSYLEETACVIDSRLETLIPAGGTKPSSIFKAMRYSLFAGGKRLRPALVMSACGAAGGGPLQGLDCGCAIEMIHTYTLIHDDLPCMDNDDFRRGKPTNHKVFGEAGALLAGDALLTHAFEVLSAMDVEPDKKLAVIQEIAISSGGRGVIGGQVMDLEAEGKTIPLSALRVLHSKKTGQLIKASVVSGTLIAGASPEKIGLFTEYGMTLGLIFQIADDLLDLTSTFQKLGKTIGKDREQQKSTYPLLLGEDKARSLLDKNVTKALKILKALGLQDSILADLTIFAAYRDH